MHDAGSESHPLADLADEFVARLRDGERPSLTDYANRHPDLADDIRELFPTLALMEKARAAEKSRLKEFEPREPKLGSEWRQLGDYRLLRELGRGGMGVVYEAEQASLGRHVALKVLSGHALSDPIQVQRFQREARAAAGLHHTNIVPVFGVGECDGTHYYVMQFIQGLGLDQVLIELRRMRRPEQRPLSEAPSQPAPHAASMPSRLDEVSDRSVSAIAESILSGRFVRPTPVVNPIHAPLAESTSGTHQTTSPTPRLGDSSLRLFGQESGATLSNPRRVYWQSVARIGMQVAEALAYAHSERVLHRDIKPSNLLLDTHGTVWVTDFGLAKVADSQELTQTGDLVGTLRYMPPERFRGESDASGDVYGLGVTLYELVTLCVPFEETERSTLIHCILNDEPQSPRARDQAIPRDLETIVLKAMSREPRDRYGSAKELADDLRRFLEDRPILARSTTPTERFWRWCRRNPRVAGLIGSVALLLLVIAIGSSKAAVLLKRERDTARNAVTRATSAEKSQRQELYRAYLNEGRASYITGRQGHRVTGTTAVQKILASIPADELSEEQRASLRDEAITYLALTDLREVMRTTCRVGERRRLDIDDTLEFLAEPDQTGTGTVVRRVDGTGTSIRLPPPEDTTTAHLTLRNFSPSGKWLAEQHEFNLSDSRHRVRVWDWKNQKLAFDRLMPVSLHSIAFHPDDEQLIVSGRDAILRCFSLTTQQEIRQSPARFRGGTGRFCDDGHHFAVASQDIAAQIIHPVTWETEVTIPQLGSTTAVVWHPTTTQPVYGLSDGRIHRSNEGDWPHGLILAGSHQGGVLDLQFSSDGRYLASSGGDGMTQLRLFTEDRLLLTVPGQVLRFLRDGRRLAVLQENQLVIYDLVASRAGTPIKEQLDSAVFSPDGNWLAISGIDGVMMYGTNPLISQGEIRLDHCGAVAFHPQGNKLLTFGIFSHLWSWPLSRTGSDQRTWQLGPAEPVHSRLIQTKFFGVEPQHQGRHAAWNADGSMLVVADYRHGQMLISDTGSEKSLRVLAPLLNAAQVAISPDGRWAAGAAFIFPRSSVWNTATGQTVLDLADHSQVAFSADGEWFATSTFQRVQLYRVGDWTPARVLEINQQANSFWTPIAFQPRGRLLAVPVSNRQIRLLDRETGRTVANLTHRDVAISISLSFSPDGSRLAVVRAGKDVVVWDLGWLRTELAELGIDCPEFGAPRERVEESPALQIDRGKLLPPPDHGAKTWKRLALNEASERLWPDAIHAASNALRQFPEDALADRADVLTLRGLYYLRNQNPQAAREDWQQALALVPETRDAILGLSRLHLLGPPEHRDVKRAASLIATLTANDAADPEAQTILGMAQVRQGQLANGLSTLEKLTSTSATKPFALYFMALAHHGLDQKPQAVEALAQAKAAHAEQESGLLPDHRDELTRLQAEVQKQLSQ